MLLASCALFLLVRARKQRKAVEAERKRKELAAAHETEKLSELAAGTGLKHSHAAMTENPLLAATSMEGEHHVPVAAVDEVATTELTNRSARTASISSPVDAKALAAALESFAMGNSVTPGAAHESPERTVAVPGSVPTEGALAASGAASKRRPSFKIAAGRASGRGWRPTAPRRGDAPGTLQFNPLRSKSARSSKKAASSLPVVSSPPQNEPATLTFAPTPASMPALEPTTVATAAPPSAQMSPPQPTPSSLERTVTDLGQKLETMMRSLSHLGSPSASTPNVALAPARATPAAPIFPPSDWASHRAGVPGGGGPGRNAEGTADAWELRVSRTTGEQYYFNPISRQHVHGWVEAVSRRTGGKYFLKAATKQHALTLDEAHSLENAVGAADSDSFPVSPPARASISAKQRTLSQRQDALRTSYRSGGGGGRVDVGDEDDFDDRGDDEERSAREDSMQSPTVQPNEWLRKWTSRGQQMFVNFFTKAKMLTRPKGAKIFVQRGSEFVLDDTDNDDGGGGGGDEDDDNEPRLTIVNPMRRGGLAGGGGLLVVSPKMGERASAADLLRGGSSHHSLRTDAYAESFSVANPLRKSLPPPQQGARNRSARARSEEVVNFGDDDVLPHEDVHDDPRSYLERYDDEKGAPYYFHIATNTTTWHPPRGSRVYRSEDDNALTRIADSEIHFDDE